MNASSTEIKTLNGGWIDAHRLPNYAEIFSAVVAIAGEGEPVTAEQVGKTPRDFGYAEILLVVLKGNEILYSFDRESGSVDVEYLGRWSR